MDGANIIIFSKAQPTQSIPLKYSQGVKIQLKLWIHANLYWLPCHHSQCQKNSRMGKVLATSSCSVPLARQPGPKPWWPRWNPANTFIGMRVSHPSLLSRWKLVSTTTKGKGPWAPFPSSTRERMVTQVTRGSSGCGAAISPRYDQADLTRILRTLFKPAHWIFIADMRQEMGSWSKNSKGRIFRMIFSRAVVSANLSPRCSCWVCWENWETLRGAALRGFGSSDHSVQPVSENLPQQTGNDQFWKQVLLTSHHKWRVKLVVTPGALPAAPPSISCPCSVSVVSVITPVSQQLCFPCPRAADGPGGSLSTERVGGGRGGVLAAHPLEPPHGQGPGLRGEGLGHWAGCWAVRWRAGLWGEGLWHLADVLFPSRILLVSWFPLPSLMVASSSTECGALPLTPINIISPEELQDQNQEDLQTKTAALPQLFVLRSGDRHTWHCWQNRAG